MARHPDYPRVSSTVVRGKTFWRFMDGSRPLLPGEPHSPEFDAAFAALAEGREIRPPAPSGSLRLKDGEGAEVLRFTGAHHKSLDAAYAILRRNPEWKWKRLELKSQRIYGRTIERILALPLNGSRYGAGPVGDLARRHVKDILAAFEETPSMERTALLCLRKLLLVAIDEEWISFDPSVGIERVVATDGHETWAEEHLALFEKFWPAGSRQRIAYALSLWLGNRASDVALLRWEHLVVKEIMFDNAFYRIEGFEFEQFKGRKKRSGREAIFLPMTPMLERELAALERRESGPVLESGIAGRAYTPRRLSEQFSRWSRQAGLPKGFTMHGLRKALAVKLVYADATTRQLMKVLGHKNIAYAETYSREIEQVRAAAQGFDKLVRYETARADRRRPQLKVVGARS